MIIYANLDCEARWAGVSLPHRVLRRISAASPLLAALAPAGEPVEIYAPAAIDPERVKLPDVTMRVGVPARWDLAWADPDAKAVNDRRFALAVGVELGVSLPSTRAIGSLADLDSHLAAGTHASWVCKAPWTAAGRDRAFGHGPRLDGELRVHIGRLIERFGAVIFEPWLDRVCDFGATLAGTHTLLADSRGAFLGVSLAPPPLTDGERAQIEQVAAAAGRALAVAGYRGSYAVDGFVYRDGGDRRLHPICEINARHTFGHVARALAHRLGTRALGFGTPPPDARILVAPAADDPVTAWVA